MTPIILDTDVVSFIFKRDSRADHYIRHLTDRQVLISFMTGPNWNSGFCRRTGAGSVVSAPSDQVPDCSFVRRSLKKVG